MKNLLRNVAYVSAIIASLTVVLHEGNKPAGAQSAIGGSCVVASDDGLFLLSDGKIWHMDHGGWFQVAFGGNTLLPIPVSQIAAFSWDGGPRLVDTNGNGWNNIGGEWTNVGPPPGCDAISVEVTTWGAVKSRF